MATKAVAVNKKAELQVSADMPIMEKLLTAVQGGMQVDMLEKFMDLAERNEKREAEKAYNQAFADFKADPPEIVKDRLVSFGS